MTYNVFGGTLSLTQLIIGIVLFCRCVTDTCEVISRLGHSQLQKQRQQQLFILTFIICIRSALAAVSSGLLLTFRVVLCVILLTGCMEHVCNILPLLIST